MCGDRAEAERTDCGAAKGICGMKKGRFLRPFQHLVHRKRFELLAFGSVDRRYIQLS